MSPVIYIYAFSMLIVYCHILNLNNVMSVIFFSYGDTLHIACRFKKKGRVKFNSEEQSPYSTDNQTN